MWVVSGPFDGVQDGVKEKLLRPGKTYTVGRAKAGQGLDGRLNIDNKAISHEHIDLIVGAYEIDDVSDSQAKPTVQLVVKREKDIWIGTSTQRVGKGVLYDLEAGIEIGLTNKVSIYVLWKPVIVVNADNRIKKERMREVAAESAKLGVTVSKTWRDTATHFITPSINMSRRVLHSLMLGVSLVDIKWLEELFRRGNELSVQSGPDEHGIVALESHFVLPNPQDFRPQLASSDVEDEDITGWPLELWDASPDRKSIWNGLQFHFFCDDTAPTEWTDQVQLGGGTFKSHNFNPKFAGETVTNAEEANALFRNIRLGAGKLGQVTGMKTPVVVVVKPADLIGVLGKAMWKVYQEGMQNNGFKHVNPNDITLAALRMDITLIDCGLEQSEAPVSEVQVKKKTTAPASSLPDFVPPSHAGDISATGSTSVITASASGVQAPSEPSEPISEMRRPRPLKRLRSQSREPSAASPPSKPVVSEVLPEIVEEDKQTSVVEVARPRLLKRRVKTSTVAEVLGLDDSSASINVDIPPARGPEKLPGPGPSPAKQVTKDTEKVDVPLPASEPVETNAPPAPRTNRLKRRADVLAERTTTAPAPIEIDIPEEPALKRYRRLFEGGQAAASLGTIGENSAALAPPTALAASDSTRKRKSADRDEDGDVDMEEATRPKRRVTSATMSQQPESGQNPSYTEPNLESSQSQSPTQPRTLASSQAHTRSAGARGAAPGAPDKDNALLDALAQHAQQDQASTSKDAKSKNKAGKGAAVDKEFSNMRIAEANDKEEASRRRAEEMRIWEECERDINVRGNFMVVELVDLVRRNRGPAARSVNPAWEGKPDFKKFKKKVTGPRGARVPVYANDEEKLDYGMGDNYWEQKTALVDTRGSSDTPHVKTRVQDDDSDTPVPQTGKTARTRPASQAAAAVKRGAVGSKAKPKTKPKRITVDLSDDSDVDDLTRLQIVNASTGTGKRRPVPSSIRKTNLADFGMRDDDSISDDEGRLRHNGTRRDEDTFENSGRTGDEDAVSHMVAEESAQVTTVGALSHMSSLGGASLGVRKPTLPSSSAAKTSKLPKKVVVVDSDSEIGRAHV